MAESNTTEEAADQPTVGAALNVLIVEDNPVNQRVAVGLVTRLGHTADIAGNGQAAVEAVQAENYDVIFMDIHMPVMDGIEATRAIRSLPGDKGHTPIIAMTAKALSGDRENCLAAGMDDYLPKPVHRDALATCLNTWGHGRADGTSKALPEIDARDLFDRTITDDLKKVAGDTGLADLFEILLDTAVMQLSDMEAAAAVDSEETIEKVAQSLRGAAANMGMVALAATAERIVKITSGETAGTLDSAFGDVRNLIAKYRVVRP